MKKYRIKKETYGDITRYFPQVRVLGWWYDLFFWNEYYNGFCHLEHAQEALCPHTKKTMVEYLDFDPTRDCK